MNSLAVKTQAPRTGTTVVTIMYNFFLYPQVYGRAVPIRCRRYAVDADDDVRCSPQVFSVHEFPRRLWYTICNTII